MVSRYVIRRGVVSVVAVGAVVLAGVAVNAVASSRHADASARESASASEALRDDLTSQVQKIATASPGVQIAVSALDPSTGKEFDFGPTSGMVAASVSKLDILEALLLAHEQDHTALTDQEDQLASAMIEHSDNDEGQTLWNSLGSAPGVLAANATLGLSHTEPDPDGYYGLTTTSPEDQLTLLQHLVGAPGVLDAASQSYALSLLHDVDSDQAWGVAAAADAGTVSGVKNGWLAIDSDNDLWAVNSDGVITVSGQQVLMSIMTQHDQSEQSGISLVESVAKMVGPGVS